MSAVRLEVETHIVTASQSGVQNLTKRIQRAGVEIDELVLAPLATAEAVLTDEDRELGVALLDIGGDTTDLAVFHGGSIGHPPTIPMGGKSITRDVGIVLRITPDVAENLKLKHGSALPVDVDPDEVVQITSIGEDVAHGVTRRTVAQIIEARLNEIFEAVQQEIAAAGATNRLQAGLAPPRGRPIPPGPNPAAPAPPGRSPPAVAPPHLA